MEKFKIRNIKDMSLSDFEDFLDDNKCDKCEICKFEYVCDCLSDCYADNLLKKLTYYCNSGEKKISKAYCVMASGGEYEDRYDCVDKAFFNKHEAVGHMAYKNAQLNIDRKKNDVSFIVYNSATSRMDDDLIIKINEYYPNNYFADDKNDYYIKVIEVE